MYPYDEDDEEEIELDEEMESSTTEGDQDENPPMEFGVDFSTGQMTGGKVTGAKAVAVWAWNALMYPRYTYELTSWNYGSELRDLIGQVMEQDDLEVSVDAIIRDAFLPNEYIEDIENLTCEMEDDTLNISLTLVTPFGEEDIDVTL